MSLPVFAPFRLRGVLFILALLLVLPTSADAQRRHSKKRGSSQVITAYPAVGLTLSQIRGDELRGFKKAGFSAGVGALVNLSDNERWKLSMEAAYSQRGAHNNTTDPYALQHFTLNYVDIPVSVHFNDPFGGMTFGLGLTYSRLVQQPHGSIYYRPNVFVPDTSDFTFLKNDLCAAIDFRFPLWRNLYLNVRYQHSLFAIKKEMHFTEYINAAGDYDTWTNDLYNSSLTIRLIYLLGKN